MMSGAPPDTNMWPPYVAGGEAPAEELGGRLAASSDNRSILAANAGPVNASQHQQPVSLPNTILIPIDPALADPALLLHAVTAAGAVVDMHPRTPNNATPRPEAQEVQHSPDGTRPLNVTDALSYLDAVKNQFADNPDIYNQFLDIMKDFKSQSIDTPGVIQRVSRLFHGNPYLIQGFNTFLPVGYRIDVSADPADPNTITVTTPSGTTIQSTNTIPRNIPQYPVQAPPNAIAGPSSRAHTPLAYPPPPVQYDSTFSPGLHNTQTNAAASFLNGLNMNKHPVEKQPAGEFNHAIAYLNKIKARFADDPNTYKEFLDILQKYQKEQRHSQDSQVYVSVQALFKDAPDLLAEFKDFLPEAMPPPPAMGPGGMPMQPQMGYPMDQSPPHIPTKKTQVVKRNRKRPEKEPTPVPPPKPAASSSRPAKKVKHSHAQDMEPQYGYPGAHSPPPTHPYAVGPPPGHGQHHMQDYPANQLLFFDRAKKSLENREMYEEFLKLLSLFSKEIIDVQMLVERSKAFLGDGDLMTEFKELVGFDDRDKMDRGPPGSIRTGPPEQPTALPVDDGEGPSYRKLPPSEIALACSGRNELCRSVLNDEWVSHPTWASEESGFVSHKKTPFEEAVHKSEEERHEYHVQIEALTRTISVLEPVNNRIDEMTNEERASFRLKPDFGGSGPALYHRIIKKIYGRDMGAEVITALQECPSVAVPVVLNRLKQKDEEWRRAQREWSRTWKEVDSKNFYKSLDHQGTNFKQNDKKNITAKYFVGDIQAVKKTQIKQLERIVGYRKFVHGHPAHQLEYAFTNTTVLQDTLKMVFAFLERSHAQYSPLERRAVEKFLKSFVPLLLSTTSDADLKGGSSNSATANTAGDSAGEDEPMQVDGSPKSGTASGRKSAGGAAHGGIPANDLRKKLLKTAQEKAGKKDKEKEKDGASSRGSPRARSPASGNRSPKVSTPSQTRGGAAAAAVDDSLDAQDIWIKDAVPAETNKPIAEKDRPFFTNTTFYTLLRLLELVYSRLLMCYEIGAKYAAQKHAPLLANKVAVDLGFDDPNGPASVLAQTQEHLGASPDDTTTNVVYFYLLTACEKLFDSELDQATFEEHMRWFFGTKAYTLFTLDKSITALIKQVQTIISDNKCQELWSLLKSAHSSKNITVQDIIRYRREAERHVGQDDHLYRLQWVRETRCIRISLCSPDEPSVQPDGTDIGRWRDYVNTYVMSHPTEWMPEAKKNASPVFLRRCVRVADEGTASMVEERLKIRISLPKYKLRYEAGGEDMLWHRWPKKDEQEMLERARLREEERRRCKLLV